MILLSAARRSSSQAAPGADGIDMSTARTDVRDTETTPKKAGYVLPKPGRQARDFIATPPRGPRYREGEVARTLGARTLALLECQERFLGELRDSLVEFEADLGEATRARLQGRVRTALSVLDWCDAVHGDLHQETQWAVRGLQPIDLLSFCRGAAGEAAHEGDVTVRGERERAWWGDSALLADAVAAAIELVRARATASPSISIEILGTGDAAGLRFAGLGEPSTEVDPGCIERFRSAANRLGGRVVPDVQGPAGTGLVLELPSAVA